MIATALIMGFAGSLHCVGMCSPLAMAVSNLGPTALLNRFIYNLGRIFTYGLLGAMVGTAGAMLPFARTQNVLSISLGVVLILVAIQATRNIPMPGLAMFVHKITSALKDLFGKFLQRRNYASIFILGSLNGMLPCGLTFLALTYCLTLNTPAMGFYYMLLFGAGTLPVMFGLTTVVGYIVKRFNISLRKVTMALLFLSGSLLIARGFMHQPAAKHEPAEIILCR